jgi:hypothetical protein
MNTRRLRHRKQFLVTGCPGAMQVSWFIAVHDGEPYEMRRWIACITADFETPLYFLFVLRA